MRSRKMPRTHLQTKNKFTVMGALVVLTIDGMHHPKDRTQKENIEAEDQDKLK